MEVSSFLPPVGSGPDIKIVDADETGFAALNAETFMKLLIAQLKNQDPLDPVSNSELLSQLSMMRNLTANIELAESIEQITANRQLNDGANFLGAFVTGQSESQSEVTGVVDRVVLREGRAFLGIGDQELPVANVTQVNHIFPEG